MKHPDWKRRHVKRAQAVRRKLTNKALARRLGISEHTVRVWMRAT